MSIDEDLQVSSEVVNADWQFDVIRTYVLGVEILDTRLSDAEFRLLTLLRLRAGGGRNNVVSYETLAKDLGTSARTIKRTMAGLKENGYVTCEARGYGASTKKTIASMSERFDADILTMNRKQLLGSERTDDMLNRLRSLNNAAEHPLVPKMSPSETTGENQVQRGQICHHGGDKNGTSEGTNLAPKVNQDNVNQIEIDSPRAARCQPPMVSDPTRSSKIEDTEGDRDSGSLRSEKAETPRDSRDDDMERAKAAADAAMNNATARSRVQLDKRRERAEREDRDGTREEREKLKRMTKQERQTIGARFEDWARNEYDLFFPEENLRMARLDEKGFSVLKRMFEQYDGNERIIRRAWTYTCENWDELRKKLKIEDTVPTIWLLYAFRARIFPLSQERQTNRQVAEHATTEKKAGEW